MRRNVSQKMLGFLVAATLFMFALIVSGCSTGNRYTPVKAVSNAPANYKKLEESKFRVKSLISDSFGENIEVETTLGNVAAESGAFIPSNYRTSNWIAFFNIITKIAFVVDKNSPCAEKALAAKKGDRIQLFGKLVEGELPASCLIVVDKCEVLTGK